MLLSLHISPFDQILLFSFTSEEQSATLRLCLKSATSLGGGRNTSVNLSTGP